MSERQRNPKNGQDVTLAQQPDFICAQFEAAWQEALQGAPWPRIETYLATAAPTEQPRLQRELETIDRDYRRRLAAANPAFASTMEYQGYSHAVDGAAHPTDGTAAQDKTVPVGETAKPAPQVTVDAADPPATADATLPPDPDLDAAAATGDFSLSETAPSPGGANQPKVAGYEILGELGRGGMGVVYKARQIGLNRMVALKMVLAGGHASADHLARFHTEAEAVAKLQHPNIVQIYEVGDQAGLPYFSLEFVDGGSLAEKLAGKPLPPRQAAPIAEQLARAMYYAHQNGIVHRDLKPANVLLTRDGLPKITDFGLAKRLEGDSSQTRSGTLMGTPSYMAPEQARGEIHAIGPLADVYALGAILYELLTGRPPFLGATMLDTLEQVRSQEPVPPTGLQPTVPRDLETICLKCLQKESPKRYPSAEALAEDLRRFQAGEPIQARAVTAPERLWRWCRRNPRVAMLSAAVLVLLVAVAISSTVSAITIARERDEKEEEKKAAVEARALAERNEVTARQERQKADQNAKIAGEQRGLALEALNTLVTKVQTQLADQPATQKLKLELLETALTGLRKVAENAERSPLADQSMAEARLRMGRIFEQLGRTREARLQFEHLHTIIQALVAADPASAQAKRNLALSYDKLGNMCLLLGEKAVARDYYGQALQLRQELAAADPGNFKTQAALALSYLRLGHVSGAALAQEHYTAALQLRQELAAATPNDLVIQRDVWIVHNQLGDLSLRQDDPPTAQRHYRAGLERMEKLVATASESPQLKHSLAVSYEKLGTVSRRLGQEDEAQKYFGQALELLQPLAAKDPRHLPVQESLVLVLARAGRHQEAAERAEHLRGLAPKNAANLYNVACCHALCASAVAHGKGNTPLTAEEQALQQRYADTALEALRQAITHGYKDLDHLQTDPDLERIRPHPAYAAIVQQLPAADDRD